MIKEEFRCPSATHGVRLDRLSFKKKNLNHLRETKYSTEIEKDNKKEEGCDNSRTVILEKDPSISVVAVVAVVATPAANKDGGGKGGKGREEDTCR